jgi:hypothetical protein
MHAPVKVISRGQRARPAGRRELPTMRSGAKIASMDMIRCTPTRERWQKLPGRRLGLTIWRTGVKMQAASIGALRAPGRLIVVAGLANDPAVTHAAPGDGRA